MRKNPLRSNRQDLNSHKRSQFSLKKISLGKGAKQAHRRIKINRYQQVWTYFQDLFARRLSRAAYSFGHPSLSGNKGDVFRIFIFFRLQSPFLIEKNCHIGMELLHEKFFFFMLSGKKAFIFNRQTGNTPPAATIGNCYRPCRFPLPPLAPITRFSCRTPSQNQAPISGKGKACGPCPSAS